MPITCARECLWISRPVALALVCLLAAETGGRVTASGTAPRPEVRWAWSGGVTARSAVVKARVNAPGAVVRLTVTRSGEPAAADRLMAVPADADGLAAFVLDGLQPATRYRYTVDLDGAAPLDGAFGTFGDGLFSFRIAFSACAETGSQSRVFDAIRAANPVLFIHTGDLHYEDIRSNDPPRFRQAYDAALTSLPQSRLFRHVPIAYTWDDHDFGGNNSDRTAASRPAALATYRQFVPHYPLDDHAGDGIYLAFSIGRVRVIITDSRSNRSASRGDHLARTMLGSRQLAWLKAELSAASAAPLVIWVNTVPWIARPQSGSDNWGSYIIEREDIANHVASLGLQRRLVMVSGDAHMVAIDDGTHSNYATGAAARGPGFFVIHAAPLDRPTSEKGGPYSHGVSRQRGQFGIVDVTDDGSGLRVDLSGRDIDGQIIPRQQLRLVCSAVECRPSGR